MDWAAREHMLHSYELIARHVMPHFQGSAEATIASNQWAYERHENLQAGRARALDRAREDYVAAAPRQGNGERSRQDTYKNEARHATASARATGY